MDGDKLMKVVDVSCVSASLVCWTAHGLIMDRCFVACEVTLQFPYAPVFVILIAISLFIY